MSVSFHHYLSTMVKRRLEDVACGSGVEIYPHISTRSRASSSLNANHSAPSGSASNPINVDTPEPRPAKKQRKGKNKDEVGSTEKRAARFRKSRPGNVMERVERARQQRYWNPFSNLFPLYT